MLLGQDQGPRFGSFIALYGVAETRALLMQGIKGISGVSLIYHKQSDWDAAQTSGDYRGSADDLRDSFIHFQPGR